MSVTRQRAGMAPWEHGTRSGARRLCQPRGRRRRESRRKEPSGHPQALLGCASSLVASRHTAAARDLLHPVPAPFVGSGAPGEPTDQTTEPPSTRHHESPGDPTGRAASHASGSNISYPELFLVSEMLRSEVSMTEQFPRLLQAAREPSEGSSPAGADGSRTGWLGDRRHSPPAPASLPP